MKLILYLVPNSSIDLLFVKFLPHFFPIVSHHEKCQNDQTALQQPINPLKKIKESDVKDTCPKDLVLDKSDDNDDEIDIQNL